MGVQGGVMDGTEPHATTAASSWDVMISYCWADAAWVLAMCEILRTEGNLRVWIDRDFMAGSTVAAMANAVKSSRVIVPCITPSYIKSANAMQELKFAFDLRKPIVPVRSGSNADIEGTEAAFMTATLLYTRVETEDLSHPSRLRAVALRLLKQILNAMGQAESPPLATNNSIGLSLGKRNKPTRQSNLTQRFPATTLSVCTLQPCMGRFTRRSQRHSPNREQKDRHWLARQRIRASNRNGSEEL
ncbi:TIR domain-containing protein [Zopfochytrium polystomum]|nr:TIR domain-containing protein [Zopfochytrium polystomum]